MSVQLPLVLGIGIGDGHQLIIAPKVHDWLLFGSGGGASTGANIISVGGSIGFSLKAGETFRIIPEVAFIYPIVGSFATSVGGSSTGGTTTGGSSFGFMQISLALLFGG